MPTGVGMAYFARCRWESFLDAHAIGGEAREVLLLHLMLGAAAVGAAWPVGILFLVYAALDRRSRPGEEDRGRKQAPVL
jgi:hypothetical protein